VGNASRWRPVLASLAPPIFPDEAISSWLFRVADIHLLTRDEVAWEIGSDPESIERGHIDCLEQVAAVTNITEERLIDAIHPDLISNPMPLFRAGKEAVACLNCLTEDRRAGRAPYIRTTWTHPLTVCCHVHGGILMPCRYPFSYHMERKGHVRNDPLKAADSADWVGLRDRLTAQLGFIAGNGRPPDNLTLLSRLRSVVGDVVDALRTETKPNMSPLVRLLNRRLMQFGPQQTQFLISDGLADLEPFDRVKHVLLALSVISEPAGNGIVAEITQEELGAETGARVDPFVVLADSLKERDVYELDLRVANWPLVLHERWEKAKANVQSG
jgi:hypothetical protein